LWAPFRGLRPDPIPTVVTEWLPNSEELPVDLELAELFIRGKLPRFRASKNLRIRDLRNELACALTTEVGDLECEHPTFFIFEIVDFHDIKPNVKLEQRRIKRKKLDNNKSVFQNR